MVRDANPSISLEVPEAQLLEDSEAADEGVLLFRAHWHLFVPSVVIAILYSLVWYLAALSEVSTNYFVRVFIVLFAVIVPLIVAWAFLRFETIRLQVHADRLVYHPGWPAGMPLELPLSDIVEVRARKGVLGSMFGGGDLQVVTRSAGTAEIRGLRMLDEANAAIVGAINNLGKRS